MHPLAVRLLLPHPQKKTIHASRCMWAGNWRSCAPVLWHPFSHPKLLLLDKYASRVCALPVSNKNPLAYAFIIHNNHPRFAYSTCLQHSPHIIVATLRIFPRATAVVDSIAAQDSWTRPACINVSIFVSLYILYNTPSYLSSLVEFVESCQQPESGTFTVLVFVFHVHAWPVAVLCLCWPHGLFAILLCDVCVCVCGRSQATRALKMNEWALHSSSWCVAEDVNGIWGDSRVVLSVCKLFIAAHGHIHTLIHTESWLSVCSMFSIALSKGVNARRAFVCTWARSVIFGGKRMHDIKWRLFQ